MMFTMTKAQITG